MKQIKDALHKAGLDTSHVLSAQLRNEARASGWPEHIVNGLSVNYKDKKFTPHVHEDHRAEALDYEYGTPSTQPTAAIRRFNNRTKEAETFLVNRFNTHLEGLL